MVSVCAIMTKHTPQMMVRAKLRFRIVVCLELVIDSEDRCCECQELSAHHQCARSYVMIFTN